MSNQKCAAAGVVLAGVALSIMRTLSAQAPQRPVPQAPQGAQASQAPRPRRTAEVGWRLAPADQSYASIDGHLMQYVKEQTAMSRRYRDAGHQFWGRITGTEADSENAQWLMAQFTRIGLSDIK